jgi:hypothetical protein
MYIATDHGTVSEQNRARIVWENNGAIGPNYPNLGLSFILAGCYLNSYASHRTNNPYYLQELEWEGWLRLAGIPNTFDSRLEFAVRSQYDQNRVQLISVMSNGGGAFNGPGFGTKGVLGTTLGLDIVGVTGPGAGTLTPWLSMGYACNMVPHNAYVGLPPLGHSTSNTTNQGSVTLTFVSSVWDGTTEQYRPVNLQMIQDPTASGNDATQVLQFQFWDRGMSEGFYKQSYPMEAFHVTDQGKVFFGMNSSYFGMTRAPYGGILMDPSQATTLRTVTWPDITGGNLVVAPSGSVPTAKTDPGTPGTVAQDATYVYICYAPNTWTRVNRATGW